MNFNTGSSIFFLAILILTIAGIIWFQFFLSKKENKWPGLIMPIICLLISLIAALGISFYAPLESEGNNVSMVFTILYVFGLYNIPTAILLVIYAGCRKTVRKEEQPN